MAIIYYDEDGNAIDDGTDTVAGGAGNDTAAGGNSDDSQSGGSNWWDGLSAEEIIRRAAGGGSSSISDVISGYVDTLKNRWMTDGQWDFAKLARDGMTVAGAVRAFQQAVNPKPIGYQGGIPKYVAMRAQVPQGPSAEARPGAGGNRYFTDTLYAQRPEGYVRPTYEQGLGAVQAQADLLSRRGSALAGPVAGTPVSSGISSWIAPPATNTVAGANGDDTIAGSNSGQSAEVISGGGMAAGGSVGRYLDGDTDGMSDEVPAEIEGNEPAALSHGEYVIPADVVSHLGNGNTKAGVRVLDQFLSRVREERTGNPKQGKEINADKLLPKFAAGGGVRHFDGTSGSGVSTVAGGAGNDTAAGGGGGDGSQFLGQESNLSNWAGEYVTDMLGKGQALSELPYEAYQGPLTAGPSALQTQGFNAAANATALPSEFDQATTAGQQALTDLRGLSYDPTKSAIGLGSYTDPGMAGRYMSPYMTEVVARQQQDAQRQADIANVGLRSQQAKSGMFGGSRGAIAEAEAARALASQKGDIMAKGLQSAYEQGANQFNQEQGRSLSAQQANMQNTQFGANYGLQAAQAGLQGASTLAGIGQQKSNTQLAGLNALLGAGQQQRAIEQEGITADYNAFNQEQMHPYKMVQFQQSLLQGLPLATQSYQYQTDPYMAAAGGASTVANVLGGAKQ